MRHHPVEETLALGFKQTAGMESHPDNAKAAPFGTKEIRADLRSLQDIRQQQEMLKAHLHEATQKLDKINNETYEKLTRNISYFQGVWGKKDIRLEEIGSHALSAPTHHKKENTEKA